MRCALALGAAAALLAASTAAGHQGNPNYRSVVRAVIPPVPGLHVRVLDYDDRLELINRTGRTVTVLGYSNEPYARVLADGTVEVNTRSPAYHSNDDRYADVRMPRAANASAAPRWTVVDRTGRFEWHDHRMHWMSRSIPPQVADEGKRTKIFDYAVPLRVGERPVAVRGTLFWQRDAGGGAPVVMFVGLGVVAVLALGAVALVRRRRARGSAEAVEAW